jgi:hypothetical protein
MTRRLAIPSSFTLRGKRWRVRFTKRGPLDRTQRGLCDTETRTIWVLRSQPRADQERTFVHELLHASAGAGDLGLEFAAEEHTIGRIEAALHAAILAGAICLEDA